MLSSTILFGTGIGSAFYMLVASRAGDPRVVAAVARQVVIADWIFTTPAVVLQPLSGFYLVHLAGFSLVTGWIRWSLILYAVAGCAWLPVVWMQMRMRDMAAAAAQRQEAALPAAYGRYLRGWIGLGVVAFSALVVVFWLMVAKPA